MKKLTYLFVLLLVFSVVAAGCGNKEAATGGNGKTTLTLFSTMSNKGERKALQNAIAEFEKQNPDFFRLLGEQKIAGIFCSPPYVGQIDYHEQHAYAYDLLGFKRKDELEIGPLYKGQGIAARNSLPN